MTTPTKLAASGGTLCKERVSANFNCRLLASLMLIVAMLIISETSLALNWNDLWETSDQQAQSAFQQQHYEQAAEKFSLPDWKAAAQYKAEQYEQVLDTLQDAKSSVALYNKGNAYTKLGKLSQALESYKKALALDPTFEDAKYNKKLVEEELEKQQQQQSKQSESGEQGEQNNQDQQDSEQSQESQPGQKDQQQPDEQQQSANESQYDDQEKNQQHAENQPPENEPNQDTEDDAAAEMQAVEKADELHDEQQDTKIQSTDPAIDEAQQASEQWLKRIPDDPAGLLKRKFKYQYDKRQRNSNNHTEPW